MKRRGRRVTREAAVSVEVMVSVCVSLSAGKLSVSESL